MATIRVHRDHTQVALLYTRMSPAPSFCLQMPEPTLLRTLATENDRLDRLPVAGVEVVPLVAGTAPVVVRSPVVGLVVSVLGFLVVEARGLLVVTSLHNTIL